MRLVEFLICPLLRPIKNTGARVWCTNLSRIYIIADNSIQSLNNKKTINFKLKLCASVSTNMTAKQRRRADGKNNTFHVRNSNNTTRIKIILLVFNFGRMMYAVARNKTTAFGSA